MIEGVNYLDSIWDNIDQIWEVCGVYLISGVNNERTFTITVKECLRSAPPNNFVAEISMAETQTVLISHSAATAKECLTEVLTILNGNNNIK